MMCLFTGVAAIVPLTGDNMKDKERKGTTPGEMCLHPGAAKP